jgi:hypothetical protein
VANEHRTARRFARPSPLFRWSQEEGYFVRSGRALVVGAGLLTEAQALLELGWEVDALETHNSVGRRPELYESFSARKGARVLTELARPGRRYRLMVLTHVLEFIEDPAERVSLLAAAAERLATDGRVLMSLRGWSDVRAAKRATPRGDGIVTGLGTWTRGFTVAEAKELLADAELSVIATPHPKSKSPEQIRLVCARTSSATPPP